MNLSTRCSKDIAITIIDLLILYCPRAVMVVVLSGLVVYLATSSLFLLVLFATMAVMLIACYLLACISAAHIEERHKRHWQNTSPFYDDFSDFA